MRILVTGGAGFIASHIVDRYISLGHSVSIIDNLSSGKDENINPGANFYKVDIASPDAEDVFKKEKPDIVNHHAGQIDVRKSLENPEFDASVNIAGTINLLELSVRYGIKKFIFASSGGAIYGEGINRYLPFNEESDFNPASPYGVSKLVAEKYLNLYKHLHNMACTALRYGNVYGPRQDPLGEAGVVAIFINAMIKGICPDIYGTGEQVRDYVFVEDVVRANELALERGSGKSYNIATSRGSSVDAIFVHLARILGFTQAPRYCPPRPGEIEKVFLDISLAKKELGWKPGYDLKNGLEKTAAFFKNRV